MATQHNFRIKNGLEVAGTERISSAGAITPQSLTVTADASVGGNLTITGNLVVNGTTTTLNTATLSVEDLNITVASGAGNSSAADGAGLTIAGASAIFAWSHSQGAMTLNKELRLDNNKGLFFHNAAGNSTLGLKADTSDNITFRQNGQWDRLVIKNDGVDIAGSIYTANSISSGFASTLKGYFYESTVDQNGTGKPSSVVGLAANIDARGEGPSLDFNAIWSAAAGYQQDNWNEGWTVARIAGIYGASGLDTGALSFYTQTSGSSGGASSASLTEKMRIDESGNVAIGNTSAFGTTSNRTVLSVNGTSSATLNIGTGGSQKAYYYTDGSFAQVSTMGTIPLRLGVSDSEKMRIAGATGNVGIGTSADPSTWAKLEVLGAAGAQTGANQAFYVRASTATANEGVGIRLSAASGSHEAVGIIGMVNNASGNAGSMTFHTYNLGATIPEVMRLDNKGNLGLGVIPTANWWANATALQISPTSALWNTSNYEDFNIGNNVYTDGTDKYLQNDAACKIRLTDSGLIDFRVASAGTAGNAISFITALAIDSAGVLLIDGSQSKASGKHDMEIGNASKSHNVFLRPYMFFGTRYSAWDSNIGWNAETDAMTTNSGLVQGTGYGASGASNLIVGADTLSWYRWAPAQCTGSGASLAVNSTYLYMQASTSGFNIKGSYLSNASDRRLKDNITPITNALDKVKQLTGNTFTWKTTIPASGEPIPEHKAGKADMGVIAQEVQEVVPTAVQLSPWDSYIKEVDNPNFNGDLETGGPQKISDPDGFTSVTGENYLTVNEEKLVPLLIEAIKELEARVAELEG